MVTPTAYEDGFEEFYTEALSSEAKGKYRVAISNYYKSVVELCGYLVLTKLNKIPRNHNEIFLFLNVSFPEIYKIVNELFKIYQETYVSTKTKEDCNKTKDGIRKIIAMEEFSERVKNIAEKTPSNK